MAVDPGTHPRTISDLAASLGVSAMTIHRAIAGKPDIASGTRTRILEEIERLGWRPNIAARGLRQGRTYTLGLLVSNVAASFLPEVMLGVDRAAEAGGYHTFVSVHEHDPSRAEHHLRTLQSKGVDGIVVYPTEAGTELAVLNEIARTTPVAVVMRDLEGYLGPCVVGDDRMGGRLAISHLLQMGHRRIGFVGYTGSGFSSLRQLGAEETLAEAGLALVPAWSMCVSRQEVAPDAAEQLLRQQNRPSAIFCASDRLAARVIQAAVSLGIEVPRDLSVVGYNGDPWGELLHAPLTTICQPRSEAGERAARLVLELELHAEGERRVVLSPTLLRRASVMPPRSA